MNQAITVQGPLDGLRRQTERLKQRAETLWRDHPRETIGAGAVSAALLIAIGAASQLPSSHPNSRPAAAPPAPPPMVMRQLAPEQALQVNAQIPIASGPNPAAAPFLFKGSSASRAQAVECLASAIYYEAGSQGDDGERAVAQIVLNRVRHPAFPSSVCGVVYQGSTKLTGCQFTFTCDGSMNRRPDAEGWKRAQQIAQAALSGAVYAPVGYATHYHANYVVPYWASTMNKIAVVGAHLFYRWAGGWGQPGAFTNKYSGHEPNAGLLRSAALAAVHVTTSPGAGLAAAIKNIPGAQPLKLAPSMRGDKRVAVRFNLVARKASEEAPHEDYDKKFAASDTLKWSLSSESVATDQKPLGRTAQPAPAAAPGAAGGAQH